MISLTARQEKWITAIIIAGFGLLALGFSLGPILEGQDEDEHFYYAHYLAYQMQLPDRLDPVHWEVSQAPLYYLMAAPLVRLAGDADYAAILARQNPYREIQIFASPDNTSKNLYVHQPDEDFPYTASPTALAVHLVRLISVAMGIGTLIACAGIFRELWPSRPDRRVMALGLAAFWPIAGWHFGMFNNDHGAVFFGTLALLLMLQQARLGPSWRGAALLGLVVSAALLSKNSAQFLAVPLASLTLLDLRRSWRYAFLTAAIVVALAGWWYARNAIVYHDFFGTQAHLAAIPWDRYVPADHSLSENAGHILHIFAVGWANYGSEIDITPPGPYMIIPGALAALAIGGLALAARRRARSGGLLPADPARRRQLWVYLSFAAAVAASLIYYGLVSTLSFQGRFLLLGIALLPAALALGLTELIAPRLRARAALSLGAGLACLAMAGLWGVYLPAFEITPLPARIEQPNGLVYGGTLALAGTDQARIEARPGETIGFRLYWRALRPTARDMALDLHTTGFTLFHRTNLPGGGALRSTSWGAGQTWSESYRVTLPAGAKPGLYHAVVTVFDRDSKDVLPPSGGRGVYAFDIEVK